MTTGPATQGAAGRSPGPLLDVRDLRVVYEQRSRQLPAVQGVTFQAFAGDRIGIIGESGSGKTTLALAISRLARPPARIVSGSVLLGGRDLLALEGEALRRVRLADLAYVPQGSMNSLNPVMLAGKQVADAIRAHEPGIDRAAVEERVVSALRRVGLPEGTVGRYPHELSGGMRQRLVIAIATALNPSVIIADEPTSALDVVVQRQVIHTLLSVQEQLGAAVILIGHDMGLMAQFATRLGVMYAGRLVELGPAGATVSNPQHPYTRALVAALPTLERRRTFVGIPGLPPSLSAMPGGCAFHPRCTVRVGPCDTQVPEPVRVGDSEVRCHLFTREGPSEDVPGERPEPRDRAMEVPT